MCEADHVELSLHTVYILYSTVFYTEYAGFYVQWSRLGVEILIYKIYCISSQSCIVYDNLQ
jgi:hypothetical protein